MCGGCAWGGSACLSPGELGWRSEKSIRERLEVSGTKADSLKSLHSNTGNRTELASAMVRHLRGQ